MPNYCNNNLIIEGDRKILEKFYDENFTLEPRYELDSPLVAPELRFSLSVPMPEDDEDWYSWNIDNWGTKWEPVGSGLCWSENSLDVDFDTAWCPPYFWLKTVTALYPELYFTLKYAEGGLNFSGILCCTNGEVVQEEEGENGDYYGEKFCNKCEDYTNWDELEEGYDKELGVCVCCRDEAFKTIASALRAKKIEQLPKKLACMRMGRNPIMDKYIMNKVFIPRLFGVH